MPKRLWDIKFLIRMASIVTLWISNGKTKDIPLRGNIVCEEAGKLYQQFNRGDIEEPEGTEEPQPTSFIASKLQNFQANKGYFDWFQKLFKMECLCMESQNEPTKKPPRSTLRPSGRSSRTRDKSWIRFPIWSRLVCSGRRCLPKHIS